MREENTYLTDKEWEDILEEMIQMPDIAGRASACVHGKIVPGR